MVLVDDDEVTEWLEKRGIERRERKLSFKGPHEDWIVIEMPAAADDRMVLSNDLLMLKDTNELETDLIWINYWEIWDSWNQEFGEFIITRLRAGGSKVKPLNTASGHLLERPTDGLLAAGILWQVMLLNWDAFLIPASGDFIVESSHDELVWILPRTKTARSQALERLAKWRPGTRKYLYP